MSKFPQVKTIIGTDNSEGLYFFKKKNSFQRETCSRPFEAKGFPFQNHGPVCPSPRREGPGAGQRCCHLLEASSGHILALRQGVAGSSNPCWDLHSYSELEIQIVNNGQTGSFPTALSKEALLNGLVATEVWMWIYVGKIRGKGGITGGSPIINICFFWVYYSNVLGPCVIRLVFE